MARTTMTATAAVQETIEIDVEIAQKLAATLSTYKDLKLQRDLLDEAMAIESTKIREEMELLGVEKLEIEGTPCAIVRGTSSKLDKQKFVMLGGSLVQLKEATVTKPKKAYLRIGAEREHDDV